MAYYKAKDTAFIRTANKIRAKTGSSAPIQWDEDSGFESAINAIQAGGGNAIIIVDTQDAAGGVVREITAVDISEDTVTAGHLESGYTAHDAQGNPITGTLSPSATPNLQAKTDITPTESSQTITADSGYNGLSSVQIDGISSSYVGSGVTRRSSSDLTASGATVTVPAGYYDAQVSKAVASGTEGTPTATKGAVSNHAVTVTPSVTNGAGYIAGETKTGTGVTVSASELVSGSETKTSNGTYDVTNLAQLVVNVPSSSSKALYTYKGLASRTANSYGATNAKVTVTKAGTYNISFVAIRGSSTGTMGTNLHIGSTEKGNQQTFNNGTYGQYVSYTDQSIAANTDVTIYATSGNNSRTIYVGQLIVEEV